MNKKTIILVSGSLLVIGVVGYFAYRLFKKKSSSNFNYSPINFDVQSGDYWKAGDTVKLVKNMSLNKYEYDSDAQKLKLTNQNDNLNTIENFNVLGYLNVVDGKRYVVISPKNSKNTYYLISTSGLTK